MRDEHRIGAAVGDAHQVAVEVILRVGRDAVVEILVLLLDLGQQARRSRAGRRRRSAARRRSNACCRRACRAAPSQARRRARRRSPSPRPPRREPRCRLRPRSRRTRVMAPSVLPPSLRIAPGVGRLLRRLVDRPVRQRRPGATSVNTMRTRVPMPTVFTMSGGASWPSAVSRLPTTRSASCSLGLPFLRVEVDQQDHVGQRARGRPAGWRGEPRRRSGPRPCLPRETQLESRLAHHGQAVVGG